MFALLGVSDENRAVIFLHQAEGQTIAIYQQSRHTEHMAAIVKTFRPKRAALKVQRLYHRAKRCIATIERAVHLRRQSRRHIPIVRIREDLIAAGKAHPAIAHRLAGPHLQQAAHTAIGLAIYAVIPERADERWIGETESGAVSRQSLGGAGGGENLRLKSAERIGGLCPGRCTKTQ